MSAPTVACYPMHTQAWGFQNKVVLLNIWEQSSQSFELHSPSVLCVAAVTGHNPFGTSTNILSYRQGAEHMKIKALSALSWPMEKNITRASWFSKHQASMSSKHSNSCGDMSGASSTPSHLPQSNLNLFYVSYFPLPCKAAGAWKAPHSINTSAGEQQ